MNLYKININKITLMTINQAYQFLEPDIRYHASSFRSTGTLPSSFTANIERLVAELTIPDGEKVTITLNDLTLEILGDYLNNNRCKIDLTLPRTNYNLNIAGTGTYNITYF